MAKNNNQKLKLAQKQWDILHNFEDRQKKSFLMSLTKNEALKIFRDLYQFAESISGMGNKGDGSIFYSALLLDG